MRDNVAKGLDFVQRLSQVMKKPEGLVERKIFNIVVDKKERQITSQFHRKTPSLIVI